MRFGFSSGRRGEVTHVDPVNPRKAVRYPAPDDKQSGKESLVEGFTRLSQADPRSGSRQPVGGHPLYPPYREDT